MSKILTDNQYYSQIANIIREQNGTSNTYKPPQIVDALKDLFYEEVEGVPPISFNGIGENLLDYRIDGASGGVGERTKNLCTNKNMVVGLYSAGAMVSSNLFITSDFIPVEYGKTYTASLFDLDENRVNNMVYEKINANKEWIGQNSTDKSITINDENIAYLRIRNFAANSQYITNNNYKYQLEEGSTETAYEPYGYKVPVVVNGKNLLQNTATSQTINGVTFTINSDKSITCNGTATANTIFRIVKAPDFPDNEDMLFTGCPVGGSSSTYQLQYSNNRDNAFQDMGNGIVLQKMDYNTYPNTYVQIRIIEGYTCNNLTFYPMIRLATIEDDTYEPYHEPTTTNIYLDEPIGENESISLSDTNTNIPTIRGTNVLTVDTTVQPSNVYVKAKKESQYETIMRERYEEAQAQLEALESGGE